MGDNMVWRWWAVSIGREWSARQIGFGGSLTRRRIGSMSHAIESYQMYVGLQVQVQVQVQPQLQRRIERIE
jgi:hypothetical protein